MKTTKLVNQRALEPDHPRESIALTTKQLQHKLKMTGTNRFRQNLPHYSNLL